MPHDRGSGPYEAGQPVTYTSKQQRVLNERWPQHDHNGPHARNIPEQPAHKHIPVQVRIVFDTDGACWVNGVATRWTRDTVFIQLDDVRVIGRHVWVAVRDVRRV